jgi:predicted AAA+ superfamily ATPase
MAHDRKRHLLDAFKKLLKFSPIVALFGHRQVGKSTFIASTVQDYRTLDDLDQLTLANANAKNYISSVKKTPMGIDECQLEPKLFPTLKEWVRTHKQPGQFVLSGSVRFTSRKAIRESLAGRMAFLEMLPFSVSEIAERPLPTILPSLLTHSHFNLDSLRQLNPIKDCETLQKHFNQYLLNGGLPGICFVRNSVQKKNSLNELHDLMLGRDLALVANIKTPTSTLKRLMGYIATNGFEPYNAAEVKRLLGLAPQTQKTILHALESIFLIRRIPVPLRKKQIILLEDQYEEWIYSAGKASVRNQLESAVYRNVRNFFAYQPDKNAEFECFLTRDGARVPIVIKNGPNSLGMIISVTDEPTLSETRSAASFLRHHANSKIIYLSQALIPAKIFDGRSLHCSISAVI